jgi:hypothetical protein
MRVKSSNFIDCDNKIVILITVISSKEKKEKTELNQKRKKYRTNNKVPRGKPMSPTNQ